jgi:hypothetical protein
MAMRNKVFPMMLVAVAISVYAVAQTKPAANGRVGLGSWLTRVEYKDLKVTQGDKVLYQSDFAKGTEGWDLRSGEWKAVDGPKRSPATRAF